MEPQLEKGGYRVDEFAAWIIENKEWLLPIAGAVFVAVGWIVRLFFKRRHVSSAQIIRSGDSSTIIQAGRNINIGTRKKRDDVA